MLWDYQLWFHNGHLAGINADGVTRTQLSWNGVLETIQNMTFLLMLSGPILITCIIIEILKLIQSILINLGSLLTIFIARIWNSFRLLMLVFRKEITESMKLIWMAKIKTYSLRMMLAKYWRQEFGLTMQYSLIGLMIIQPLGGILGWLNFTTKLNSMDFG